VDPVPDPVLLRKSRRTRNQHVANEKKIKPFENCFEDGIPASLVYKGFGLRIVDLELNSEEG
jgi:hypothetical protein